MTQLTELIDQIYDAATDPEGFHGVARAMTALVRSTSCAIVVQSVIDYQADGGWYWGVSDALGQQYKALYYRYDPTVVEHFERARETAYASVHNCDSPIYHTNRFLNELCKPEGLGYFAGVYTPLTESMVLRLTVQGAATRGQFDSDDLAMLDAVIPHLRRGVEIHRKFLELSSQNTAISTALESAQSAIILLDQSHRVAWINSAARVLLGNGIVEKNSQLRITDAAAKDRFAVCLTNCFAALSGQMAVGKGAGYHLSLPRSGLPSLSCYVAPVRMPAGDWNQPFPRNLVAVQLFDPQRETALAPELLQNVLGLTPAEARVASALCAGDDAKEIAEKLELSTHTVRDHIKRIYSKMGVSKQSECVARAFAVLAPHLQQAHPELAGTLR